MFCAVRNSRKGRIQNKVRGEVKKYEEGNFACHWPGLDSLADSLRRSSENRFYPNYPGYDVRVLFSNDEIAHGGKLLSTVRETYLEE